MRLMQLLLLVLAGLFVRRLWRSVTRRPPRREPPAPEGDLGNLTQQDISDADFEEIP